MAFVDIDKAFDNVKWYKLFQILRKIGLYYREEIFNLYKEQVPIIQVEDQEREAKIGKELDRVQPFTVAI